MGLRGALRGALRDWIRWMGEEGGSRDAMELE